MGDRTRVTLTILRAHRDLVDDFLQDASNHWRWPQACDLGAGAHSHLAHFEWNEVNYGELDFLPDFVDRGVAYNSEWEEGGEYGAGTEHLRFDSEGVPDKTTIYAADVDNVSFSALQDAAAISLEAVHGLIKKTLLVRHVLPWDNQLEYGQIHRLKNLIGVKSS
jgi:hypothetical protein